MRYAIAMYQKNRPVLMWDPTEKYFLVIAPCNMDANLYERLIPSCCVTLTDTDERYNRNCEIFAEELHASQLSSYDEILETLKTCDGTDESVFAACDKLTSMRNCYSSYTFRPVPVDCGNLLKY